MQGRNGDPDAQDRAVGMVAGWGGLGDGELAQIRHHLSSWLVGNTMHHRELNSVLRDDPQGCDEDGRGEVPEGGDLRVHTTDALPCAAETNNIVKKPHSSLKRMQHCVRVRTHPRETMYDCL